MIELTRNQWIIFAVIIVIIILIILYMRNKNKQKDGKHKVENVNIETPKNFKADTGDGMINLSWDKVDGATDYTIYFSQHKDFSPEHTKRILHIPQTKLQVGKMGLGSYYFKVSANKASNGKKGKQIVESKVSDVLDTHVTVCSTPEPPTTVELVKKNNDVEINWTQSSNADGYYVYVNNDEPPSGDETDHAVIKVEGGNITSHVLKDIPDGFDWYVTIRPYGLHCGNGQMSKETTISV